MTRTDWWDNTFSIHGAVKQNRTIGKSIWDVENIYPAIQSIVISQAEHGK